MLNNNFVIRAAAERLLEQGSTAERVHGAFVRFYGRPPTAGEREGAEEFITAYRAQLTTERVAQSQQERELWSAFCQVLFASAKFQYRM